MTDKTLSSQNYLNPKTTAPMMTSTSTSSSHPNTAIKNRSATHNFETPYFAEDSDSCLDNDETPISSKKKVIYTPKGKEHAKIELNLAQRVLSNNSNNMKSSVSPASSSAYIHTVIKNNNQDGNQSKSASTLASTPSARSRRLETQDIKEKSEGQLPEFKFGKRKIQYLDDLDDPAYYTSDDDDYNEIEQARVAEVDSETAEDSFEIRKPSVKSELLETKRVKLNSDEKRRPVVSTVFLMNSNGTKSYTFPVYRDCDLNVVEEWQNKLREADIDNDCDTEQEILDYSIYQAKKDLVQGIQMQREEHTQLIKTAQKTGRNVFSQEVHLETAKRSDKPFEWNDQKVENKKQEDEGFFAKVSRNFKDLLGSSDKKK